MSADPRPEPVGVSTDHLDIIAILKQSIDRNNGMKRGNPSYGRTSLEANDVGLYGEHAVLWWLRRHLPHVEHVADDLEHRHQRRGDIALRKPGAWDPATRRVLPGDAITLEVKTNRHSDWGRYGRGLNAAQLDVLKAHAIVWCVVADTLPGTTVDIMGWLPTEDATARDAGRRTIEHNRAQWRVTRPMRDIRDLPGVVYDLDQSPRYRL